MTENKNTNMTDHSKHRTALENKARELAHGLRRRDRIAIEAAPEEAELSALAGQRDLAVQTMDRDASELREIRAALARLAGGEFGRCEKCERAIPARRLEAIPWARCCVSCQESVDREGGPDGFRSFRFAA